MRNKLIITALFSVLFFSFCRGEKGGTTPEWGMRADSSTRAFITNYWNPGEKYFNYGNGGSKTEFHYWPQAHALDLLAAHGWLAEAAIATGPDGGRPTTTYTLTEGARRG